MSVVGLLIPGQSPVRGHRSVTESRAGLVEGRSPSGGIEMFDYDRDELVVCKRTGLTTPSTRMLVVVIPSAKLSSWESANWKSHWDYYPVKALCTVTRRHYAHKVEEERYGEGLRLHRHKDLVELGWELVRTAENIEPLFLAPDVTGELRLVTQSEYRVRHPDDALGLVVPD